MSYFDRTYNVGFGFSLTKAVKYLLISNIAIYLLLVMLGESFRMAIFDWFQFSPSNIYPNFRFWTFGSYMFLHVSFGHLLFNMFALWMFGCEVEREWGTKAFFKYYIICGIGGAIFYTLFNIFGVVSPMVGSSGAIYGILLAYAVLFRERVITLLLFFILPVRIKAKHLIAFIFGMSLIYFILLGGNDGIAHSAHLGGVVFGFLYLRIPIKLPRFRRYRNKTAPKNRMSIVSRPTKQVQNARDQVDSILDKINEVGYENLTEKEKKILTEYSKLLSKEQDE